MADKLVVGWRDAPQAISRLILERRVPSRIPVVGIGGPVGSGKTSLARRFDGAILSLDDYNYDFSKLETDDYDQPETADLDLAAEHIRALALGASVDVPIWSHQVHYRVGTRRVSSSTLILCEGIHALAPTILPTLDVAVLVTAPMAVRRERWRAIEEAGERSWGVEKALRYFDAISEPAFARFEKCYMANADIIIENFCMINQW